MRIDFEKVQAIFVRNWPLFWHGIKITCLFALVGTFFGFLIGLLLGGFGSIKVRSTDTLFIKGMKKALLGLIRFYIWVFRGTPMMVQAIFLYYLFRPVLHWNSFTAGLIIISINTGAYMAEIVRSGIQAVDPGQLEACQSIGFSFPDSLFYVILPQAIRNSFPSIGNQLIVNIKDSSMLNVLSVTELFFQTSSIAGSNYRYIETYLISAVIYLVLTTAAGALLNALEKRINSDGKKSAMLMEYSS
ncbi:MAG: amino acid ABC transporter permease [Erysipelotrichaceae bacterium]|nr:amino acid ABC transporter permease [Erysipelotrichaceae bacterium]